MFCCHLGANREQKIIMKKYTAAIARPPFNGGTQQPTKSWQQGWVRGGIDGMLSNCLGRQSEQQKNDKNKTPRSLRQLPHDFLHATTNQKHAGATE
jgi:hypothetical protein